MEDFETELKRDFLDESQDLLAQAESAFLRLEEERENADLLNEIFRVAHNLKGTSKAVGFDQMAELTHVAENLILKLKEGQLEANDSIVSGLLEFKDQVSDMIGALQDDLDAVFDIAPIVGKLEDLSNGVFSEQEAPGADDERFEDVSTTEELVGFSEEIQEESAEEIHTAVSPETPVEISSAALESLAELGVDISQFQTDAAVEPAPVEERATPTLVFHNVEEEAQTTPERSVRPAPDKEKKSAAAGVDESIRVSLSRIDKINNIIGELVILQTVLSQRSHVNIKDDLSNKSISMMGKLFKEVQETAMSLRMLPLKGTFQKMNRIVRDTSKELKKDARLVMVGEDTEVDKTVLERISDPLVHIVRNAVDHGLESSEERAAAGKDPRGSVEIMAYHEGSNLAIQITDDGKGIDPERIRAKAIQKGVLSPGTAMSDDEVIQLIFHPGFSTKEQVTEVSGRGVGMDVVKTNIEGLGGQVAVSSKLGQGSSFKILIPLTLAIVEGLVVASNDQKYVVPLSQIFELTQVRADEIERFTGAAELFRLRGEVIPLFHLNKKLGEQRSAEQERQTNIVVIARHQGKVFGVAIDDALNQQQIVIKKLGEDLQGRKGIMGSAIMSDGKPSLILDFYELFKDDLKESRAHKRYKEQSQAA